MALPYFPHPGEVLICDFDDVAAGAEMVKRRPVIVVSRRESHGRFLATVVPLSTTRPDPVQLWHHELPHLKITGWQPNGTIWAKCDMLATASFDRLNKPYLKTRHGRNYVTHRLDVADLEAVRACLRAYLLL
jgi:mRNA interferase MazF